MSISKISNTELLTQIRSLAKAERKITRQILERISEVETRRLYAELGFPSTFAWLVGDLGYSHGAADRRLKASRYIRDVPTAAVKVESGDLNVTTLSMAQRAIQNEERRSGQQISLEQKINIGEKITSKSSIETEKVIHEIFPELIQTDEKVIFISEGRTRINLTLAEEQWRDLERVREITSHSHGKSSLGEVIHMLSQEFLNRKDALRRTPQRINSAPEAISEAKPTSQQPPPDSQSAADYDQSKPLRSAADTDRNAPPRSAADLKEAPRTSKAVSASAKRFVRQRDQDRCTFLDPRTGRICGSRRLVQIDHIQPRAIGGGNDPENLRCLCRAHNLLRAEKTFQSRYGRPVARCSQPFHT
jgi:hypothetical protein